MARGNLERNLKLMSDSDFELFFPGKSREDILRSKDSDLTWEELTRPLREAAAKAGLREEDVPKLIQRVRKQWREQENLESDPSLIRK